MITEKQMFSCLFFNIKNLSPLLPLIWDNYVTVTDLKSVKLVALVSFRPILLNASCRYVSPRVNFLLKRSFIHEDEWLLP